MADSIKTLLIAAISLLVGYFLGSRQTATDRSGRYVLSTPDTGRFLTDTHTGKVWILQSPDSTTDPSKYRWSPMTPP
jgi:hypothetical protein